MTGHCVVEQDGATCHLNGPRVVRAARCRRGEDVLEAGCHGAFGGRERVAERAQGQHAVGWGSVGLRYDREDVREEGGADAEEMRCDGSVPQRQSQHVERGKENVCEEKRETHVNIFLHPMWCETQSMYERGQLQKVTNTTSSSEQ